jgi:SAM-dependent methyltransferase
MRRRPSEELLDSDMGSPAEVARSLQDLQFLNRYFGGVSTSRYLVKSACRGAEQPQFTLLDVAAGAGYVVDAVSTDLKRDGVDIQSIVLDRSTTHMPKAKARVAADAFALPFADDSFDFVHSCLFVHHLSPENVKAFLQEALRCARRAVLINDLIRSPIALGVALAGRAIYRSRLTRNDAPASVRQAFTGEELRSLLNVGRRRIQISKHFFYRMGVIVWKESASQ